MSYREYQGTQLAPGWLQGTWGRRWLESFGDQKDWTIQTLKEGVKARLPDICPADALPLIGADRLLNRGGAESEESYRARLLAAWAAWQWAGTPYGLLVAFYWAGYRPAAGKVVLQVQLGKQYELRSDFDPAVHAPEEAVVVTDMATPVHLGGPPELWSQFAVLFRPPFVASWIPTPPADGSAEVEQIRRTILQWKSGHARCVRLQVSEVELWGWPVEAWGPTTELWGEAGTFTDWTPPVG